jgi:2'-5' RNA ligase
MRIFIAVNFPSEVCQSIKRSVIPMMQKYPQISWTKTENIHLTLKFLGNIGKKFETKSKNVNPQLVQEYLFQIKSGILRTVEILKPFEFIFEKWGYFDKDELVIWLGGRKNYELEKLVKSMDKEMEKLGFPADRKIFVPHITIGRGKKIYGNLLRQIKQEVETDFGSVPGKVIVGNIDLMESVLTLKGPIYNTMDRFALRKNN